VPFYDDPAAAAAVIRTRVRSARRENAPAAQAGSA
jgi:hypothetical protein